jgi:hypothetical protein
LQRTAVKNKLPFSVRDEYMPELHRREYSAAVKQRNLVEHKQVDDYMRKFEAKSEDELLEDVDTYHLTLESGEKLPIVDVSEKYINKTRERPQDESEELLENEELEDISDESIGKDNLITADVDEESMKKARAKAEDESEYE